MAVTSSEGYAGTVGYDTHAKIGGQGARYAVEGSTALAPSVGVGDRVVTTGAGVAVGCTIRDTLTATDVTLDAVGAGVRHDMIVLRRDWSTNTSTVVAIQGGTTEALPTRNTEPGALDDQPLALWRVTAGSTVPVLVADLRLWTGLGGGWFGLSDKALDFLAATGTHVTIGTTQYVRVISSTGAGSWLSDARPAQVFTTPDAGWPNSLTKSASGILTQITIPSATYARSLDVDAVVSASVGAGQSWEVRLTSSLATSNPPALPGGGSAIAPFSSGASVGGSSHVQGNLTLAANTAQVLRVWAIGSGTFNPTGTAFTQVRVRTFPIG